IALLGLTQTNPIFFIVGIVIFVITLFLWIRDAIAEFKALPEGHGDHGHGHDDHADAAAADTPAH
ncbi:hypothetical protein, partial [Klebsiella pneumoniae]|uniref:hypothetical protein n=1 Tax=Klebsiella pneumoniae TaxID=573 RepID=UPI0037BE6955